MRNLFLAMTLGNDPHTQGVFNAGKIAKMAGVDFELLPPDMPDEEKLRSIHDRNPAYIGLSYRLSPDKAIGELKKFMRRMEEYGLLRGFEGRRICFAGLLPTLKEVHNLGIDSQYGLELMGSYPRLSDTTRNTALFFGITGGEVLDQIIEAVRAENEPERIGILDQLAREMIENGLYAQEPPLRKPSALALISFPERIRESELPVVRSHFGVPDETIRPTMEGIDKIANAGAVDEISIGSSDLSQRYYGDPQKFRELKNDGGVPYKDINDLRLLALSAKTGNFPSLKPYCHVRNIIPFIEDCLSVGMLRGAHQAIPLFWFNELDGRGDMTVEESIDAHLEAVAYLAKKDIPVEMNDPNQWSSRYIHDALFVVSYALIASVMYASGVRNMVLQCQFNKPATTGDYADLGKFLAAKRIVEALRPRGNTTRVYYECRSGIEHFSPDLNRARIQLPRSVMLQMLIDPSILHLVSYCEADHVATADDVIESSRILRYAVRTFRSHREEIISAVKDDVVNARAEYLYSEAMTVLRALAALDGRDPSVDTQELWRSLSKPEILKKAMLYRYMTAPGIANKRFANNGIFTKVGRYGFIDCYENWDDPQPMREAQRIGRLTTRLDG